MTHVVTKFNDSHQSLVMLADNGDFTLHADKASTFTIKEAYNLLASLNASGVTHYVSPKPKFGFDGMNPI